MSGKFFRAIALALVLIIFPGASANGAIWEPSLEDGANKLGITINENFDGESSFLIANADMGKDRLPNQTLCQNGVTASGPCSFKSAGVHPWGSILLPPCKGTSYNCIEQISYEAPGVEKQKASFVRLTAGPTLKADRVHALTEGSTVSLWSVPSSLDPEKKVTYAAYAKLSLNYYGGKFHYGPLTVELTPIQEIVDPSATRRTFDIHKRDSGTQEIGFGGGGVGCYFSEDGICGKKIEFEPGVRLSVSLNLTNEITGWFKGRLFDPELSVSKLSALANRVIVEAEPATVPKLQVVIPKDSVTPAISAFYKDFWMEGNLKTWNPVNVLAEQPEMLRHLSAWRSAAKDRISGSMDYWVFGTSNFLDEKTTKCTTSKTRLMGLVTTNAMVYQGSPPIFSGGFLNYQVAGMHWDVDSEREVKGTYDLIIRSDVARCIYGLPKVPLYASVSVTGGSDQEIATTQVSDDGTWLKMAAYGFTFSNKTIKIKVRKK